MIKQAFSLLMTFCLQRYALMQSKPNNYGQNLTIASTSTSPDLLQSLCQCGVASLSSRCAAKIMRVVIIVHAHDFYLPRA
jgi:hypothetical protein